jgi:hypothetical protein
MRWFNGLLIIGLCATLLTGCGNDKPKSGTKKGSDKPKEEVVAAAQANFDLNIPTEFGDEQAFGNLMESKLPKSMIPLRGDKKGNEEVLIREGAKSGELPMLVLEKLKKEDKSKDLDTDEKKKAFLAQVTKEQTEKHGTNLARKPALITINNIAYVHYISQHTGDMEQHTFKTIKNGVVVSFSLRSRKGRTEADWPYLLTFAKGLSFPAADAAAINSSDVTAKQAPGFDEGDATLPGNDKPAKDEPAKKKDDGFDDK